MADHTLAIDYTWLRREIARSVGYRRDPEEFTEDEAQDVDDIIASGCRQAYWPHIPGQQLAHKWSFLRPYREFTLTSDLDDIDLPDDFGAFEGDMTYSKNDNSWYKVEQVSPQHILWLRENNQQQTTGYPRKFAVAPRKTDGSASQRHYFMVWPTPDATYNMKAPVRIIPQMLSEHRPFPYGGPEIGELILASCLAVAELKLNGEKGVMSADFQEKLMAAVAVDAQKTRGVKVGYNGNGNRFNARYVYDNHIVTYDGQEYTGP